MGTAVALDRLFDLSKPGSYTLLVSYNAGIAAAVARRIRFDVRAHVGIAKPRQHSTPAVGLAETARLSRNHASDWEDVHRFAGRDYNGLVLDLLVSPVPRREIWLVFSLQNVDAGNRKGYAKTDMVPGICFIHAGKSVSLDFGARASDYCILIRDASGKTQIFSADDAKCYEHVQDFNFHSLAPGDGVGFAAPVEDVFAYAVVKSIPRSSR